MSADRLHASLRDWLHRQDAGLLIAYGVLTAIGILMVAVLVLQNLSKPMSFNAVWLWATLAGTPITIWYYRRHRHDLPALLRMQRSVVVVSVVTFAAWAYFIWFLHEARSDAGTPVLFLVFWRNFLSSRVRKLEAAHAAR